MVDQEELDRIAEELQIQQERGEAIRQQIQVLQANAVEIGAALQAIENLGRATKDVLVPLGAGAYLSCPKPDQEKVIISIGANVLVNKKPEEALKILQERQKKVTEAIEQAQKDLEGVTSQIDQLSQAASRLAAEAGNVRPSEA